jgi:hypothetical protein
MTKLNKKNHWIHVRVTELEFNLIQILIDRLNVTRSELLRKLILAELFKQELVK